jgi:hypothetical protein
MDELAKQRSELAARVAHDKNALREAVDELKTVVSRRFNVGEQMSRQPAPWLIGGFCVGLLLGLRR